MQLSFRPIQRLFIRPQGGIWEIYPGFFLELSIHLGCLLAQHFAVATPFAPPKKQFILASKSQL